VLGFPTTSDAHTPDGGGYFVRFQGGDVYWSPATNAQVVRGAIRDAWLAAGGSGGYLGYPTTSDAVAAGGKGAFVRFQGGDVYWSPSTGTQIVRGAILSTWLAWGGSGGVLGFPTTSDAHTADGGGYFVRFQGGDVYWSPATNAQVVRGGILDAWLATGGSGGPLGYPTRSDAPTPDRVGATVPFQHGQVYWSPATGSRVVADPINPAYAARGGTSSSLGYPTDDTHDVAGGRANDFQHGTLTWNSSTGKVTGP
jgi:uncharacterized protein with LGFP repeats